MHGHTNWLGRRWRDTFRSESNTSELGILDMLEVPHVLVLDEWGGEGLTEFVEKALTLMVARRPEQKMVLAASEPRKEARMGQRHQ